MRKMITLFVLSILIATFYTGCYYDKADLVYPAGCDTVNMKYNADIVPILTANCYVCHGGTATGSAGRKFDTHPLLLNYVNNGKLMKAITHSAGAVPMPYNMPKLPECTINKIKSWVDRGALNN